MQPTPKWNEELPLQKKPKIVPPRRFEITIDKQKPINIVVKQPSAAPRVLPRKGKHMYEIRGISLRDDELIEKAADVSNDGLYCDSSGIHRIGERIPQYPSGRVISRAKLRHMAATGQLRKPPNMVNSFPSARIRRRAKPLGKRLSMQALAVANPAAFRALAIHPEARIKGTVVLGFDGSVYVENEMGLFKKIGRFVKKGVKKVGKVAKKGVKITAKVARPVVRPVTRFTKKAARTTYRKAIRPAARGVAKGAKFTYKKGIRPVARFAKKNAAGVALTVALGPAGLAGYVAYKNRGKILSAIKYVGKLTGKAFVEIARAISSLAATPIRIAFRQFIGVPRAKAIAASLGHRSPTRADKAAAVKWGFKKIEQKMGPLGKLCVEILKFTRGVPLSGVGGRTVLGSFDRWEVGIEPATITAIAGAITAGLAALKGVINMFEGLKKGKPVQALNSAAEAATYYQNMKQNMQAATAPPGQMPQDPGYGGYGNAQSPGGYDAYGTAQDYEMPPSPTPEPYPGYDAPAEPQPYGYDTPGMLSPDPMNYPADAPPLPYEEQYAADEYYPPAPMTTEMPTSYDTSYDTDFSTMGGFPPLISFG